MTGFARRQLGRTDRYVQRGRLRLGAHAPRNKLAFIVEESLRLCTLAGEDEGRVYYFRRLRVTELPEDGDRGAWLSAFQHAMEEQASQAIHGLHPRAAAADAVYFNNEQEACESLLMLYAVRRPAAAWYWPHVSGVSQSAGVPAQITGLIERLLATPAGWTAAAGAVLSVMCQHDVLSLITLLPDEAIGHWLREMGASDSTYPPPIRFSELVTANNSGSQAPFRFSEPIAAMLTRATAVFGPDAPKVLWLAALAVIAIQPSSADSRSAVQIARASLHTMLAHDTSQPSKKAARPAPPPAPAGETDAALELSPETAPPGDAQAIERSLDLDHSGAAPRAREEVFFGEPTAGAGLYFLLNALRQLQIEEQQFSLVFLARLFVRIAAHAGIEAGDPVLRWPGIIEDQSTPEEIDERLLRIWFLKVRRWCWRHGRITVREIVQRAGYITLTRTDLDVSLSIDSADVRIRKIGLDLNPGWLPWFGRVVRFHYRYRGGPRG
ncbi:MAG TPA: hypothetical protein VGK48_20135 [Terriglobia bacterium]|jgi:hypothetical protein